MKKVLIALAMFAVVTGVNAQDKGLSNASVDKIDAETRALVARVYPAFVLIGGGSGVCISEDGYFVTNHHVWSEAAAPSTQSVRMAGNSRRFSADAVGADPRGDIVLGKLKLDEGQKVPFVKLGDSDKVNVGDICLAIGNPFLLSNEPGSIGAEPTVTLGTITATHRFQGGYNDCIQIDTAINPGNSGGPSFNLDGEVIGINGRNIASHGKRFNTGAGYAIPSSQIRNFIEALKANDGGARVVRHGIVGGLSVRLGGAGKGAEVTGVEEGSEAADAGFKDGDVIGSIDGKPVFNGYRYYGIIGTKPRNSQFTFKVKRGEESIEINARNDVPTDTPQFSTVPRPDAGVSGEGKPPARPRAAPPNDPFRLPEWKSTLGFAWKRSTDREARGLAVTSFLKGSPLETAGMQVGDVITQINGRKTVYFSDITDIMIAIEPKTEVTVSYIRGKETGEVKVATVKP